MDTMKLSTKVEAKSTKSILLSKEKCKFMKMEPKQDRHIWKVSTMRVQAIDIVLESKTRNLILSSWGARSALGLIIGVMIVMGDFGNTTPKAEMLTYEFWY